MKTILWTVSLLLVICGCTPKPTEVVSPDGHIRLQFALDDHNRMTYRIDVDDTAFVTPFCFGIPYRKGCESFGGYESCRYGVFRCGRDMDTTLGRE